MKIAKFLHLGMLLVSLGFACNAEFVADGVDGTTASEETLWESDSDFTATDTDDLPDQRIEFDESIAGEENRMGFPGDSQCPPAWSKEKGPCGWVSKGHDHQECICGWVLR